MHASRRVLRSVPPTIRAVLREGPQAAASSPSSAPPPPPQTIKTDADLCAVLESSRTSTSDLSKTNTPDQKVYGWLRSVRAHKNVAFVEVDDGTSRVQGVLKGKGRAEGLSVGTSVCLTGGLEASKGKGQDVEFIAQTVEVLGGCDPETYPIQKKSLPLPYLRDHAHLRFRTAQTAAIMRVRDGLMRDWHDWFEENEFIHVHTPILTSSDCEGAGETFKLENPILHHHSSPSTPSTTSTSSTAPPRETFFPTPVNLTVSSQLHLEAPTHALARTYTLSPSFRAEPSLTSRHLSEFYMLEAEIAFVDTLDSLLDVVEQSFQSVAHRVMWSKHARHARLRGDLETIRETIEQGDKETDFEMRGDRAPLSHLINLAARPFTRITYTQAVEMCAEVHEEVGFNKRAEWGEGLGTEHEKWLARHNDGPVFVTHYPRALKPFYMLPSRLSGDGNDSRDTVACFDLLFPGIGELVGGSLREHRYDELLARIRSAGLDEAAYQWYLDLRRYGSVPHGGWGMGWDRWVCWVTGVGNIRDVVPFPRWRGNCKY